MSTQSSNRKARTTARRSRTFQQLLNVLEFIIRIHQSALPPPDAHKPQVCVQQSSQLDSGPLETPLAACRAARRGPLRF